MIECQSQFDISTRSKPFPVSLYLLPSGSTPGRCPVDDGKGVLGVYPGINLCPMRPSCLTNRSFPGIKGGADPRNPNDPLRKSAEARDLPNRCYTEAG